MRVNAEQCTGCGACVETCPSGAIHLNDGITVLDQAVCTECQACVDVCPVGAISAVELPVVATKPAVIQPVREAEVVVAESIHASPKPWLSAALVFARREILPRLADALITALDRRLAQSQLAQPQTSLPFQILENSSRQNSGRGPRWWSRFGQVRQHGRGQGRCAGRRNWL